jgi:light-regulated signal transduction histidine kinase (bacteriophytochrome)
MGADLELSGRRRDGTTFPAEIALSALDTDQGLLVSAAIRDVTQQRRALDDLRRINQNLTSFSYSLAHDLRTPLRSLAGFSTALIEEYASTLGEDGCAYAQRIEAASEHMGHILDDLLHLSGISEAKISLQQVDLGAGAAAIAAELQRQDRAAASASPSSSQPGHWPTPASSAKSCATCWATPGSSPAAATTPRSSSG